MRIGLNATEQALGQVRAGVGSEAALAHREEKFTAEGESISSEIFSNALREIIRNELEAEEVARGTIPGAHTYARSSSGLGGITSPLPRGLDEESRGVSFARPLRKLRHRLGTPPPPPDQRERRTSRLGSHAEGEGQRRYGEHNP